MSGAAPAAGHGLDPFHTMIGSGPDHVRRRGPTPGASGCPSGPRADRRRVRRLPHGRRRFKRAGSASWWIDARTKAFEAVARHLPQCRSRRITLKRHRERREEKPMQRRLLLHCAASTGDKLRVNTPAGPVAARVPLGAARYGLGPGPRGRVWRSSYLRLTAR